MSAMSRGHADRPGTARHPASAREARLWTLLQCTLWPLRHRGTLLGRPIQLHGPSNGGHLPGWFPGLNQM